MRKVSTLVGLTAFALATSAGLPTAAFADAPSDSAAATTAPAAETQAAPAAPAAETTPAAESTPAAPAAESTAAVAAPAEETPANSKLQVGIGFVAAGMGTYKYQPDPTKTVESDAAFAYGLSLSVGYEVLPNFVVGIAPQLLLNVKEKEPEIRSEEDTAVKQIDILARLAYEYPVVETIRVYAEVLPGYSMIRNTAGSKGFILAGGLGVAMDIADRYFLNVGAGYQLGFQKWTEGSLTYDTSTRFIRVVLGGGIRL